MNYLLFLSVITFIGCTNQVNPVIAHQQVMNGASSEILELKNQISKDLSTCLPQNWTMWEEYSEDEKTSLAHIGFGIFDLHFKAKYEFVDTLLDENYNGKNGDTYYPELVLHFYKNEESIKDAVKFTHENAEIISDFKFAQYFGETEEYLIYECSFEQQAFSPEDPLILELRECLLEQLKLP